MRKSLPRWRYPNKWQQQLNPWLFITIGVLLLWAYNWKLLLATAIGITTMWLVYVGKKWNWHKYWISWQKLALGGGKQLTLAVVSGAIAAFTTYMITTIWAETENQWLAVGVISQGLISIITLSLVWWQVKGSSHHKENYKYEQLLQDLNASEPLKRLMAVRQLTRWVIQHPHRSGDLHQVEEYFRLMYRVEAEDIIRDALVESLLVWEKTPIPLNIPQKQPKVVVHQPNP